MLDSMERMFDDYFNRYGQPVDIDSNKKIKAIFKEIDDRTNSIDNKYIITPKDIINQGSVIEGLGCQWLTIEKPVLYYKNYDKSIIRKITTILKFVIDGEVVEIPSIIDTKILDIQTNQYMSLVDGQVLVTFPKNKNSLMLDLDKRFLTDPQTVWKFTGFDYFSKDSLIIAYAKRDLMGEDDDKVNLIANYKTKIAIYKLEILNGDSIEAYINKSIQLNLQYSKTINKETTTITPLPEMIYTSSDMNIAQINSDGLINFVGTGSVTITATAKDNPSATDSIIINVIATVAHNYTINLTASTTTGLSKITSGTTCTYTAKLFDNGTEIQGALFDFVVDKTTNTPTNAFNVVNTTNNSIDIKCIKDGGTTPYYIILNTYWKDNHDFNSSLKIRLKSLL
ncbi:Ig-like domain-containing protein [Clostridium carboxidivorans]|nr:Ig-like domain-containing protein [Clostridium carboxidivorans]